MAAKTGEYTWSVMRMAAGFFFVFMAFNTTQALETTVLTDTNLAYASLGTIYGVFTAVCILAPRLVELLGPKAAMMLGAVPYVLMVFANMDPSWGLLIPASAGVGAGAAILWTGQGIYMSRCAIREAQITGEPVDVATSRMNGLFWTAFQFNAAVGLVASSLLLESVSPDSFKTTVRYMFAGFGGVGVIGILIFFTVRQAPPLSASEGGSGSSNKAAAGPNDDEEETAGLHAHASVEDGDGSPKGKGAAKQEPVSLVSTLRLLVSSRPMQLLVPIIFYNGTCLGFFNGTYPLIYQDSSSGAPGLLPKSGVGYVAATFYVINSLASYLWGKFVIPAVGRKPLFIITGVTHLLFFGLVLGMATGKVSSTGNAGGLVLPHGGGSAYAITIAGAVIFAIGDSVMESQIPAIVQSPSFFPVDRDRDAGNSNNRMWQSLGFALQFGVSIVATPTIQALYQLGLLTLALLCLWACDSFVRPIEAPKDGKDGEAGAEYRRVAGEDD